MSPLMPPHPPATRMIPCTLVVLGLLCFTSALRSQNPRHGFFGGGQVTAGSVLYLYPQSSDPSLRSITKDIGSAWGIVLGYDAHVTEVLRLRCSMDYQKAAQTGRDDFGTEVSDGFRLFAAEIVGGFSLPFNLERFCMLVGGGGGMYLASRDYSVAGLSSESLSSSPGWGLVIFLSAEYRITDGITLGAEMRFRDPVVNAENRFSQSSISSHGVLYPLSTTPFPSRINLNGNLYRITIGMEL